MPWEKSSRKACIPVAKRRLRGPNKVAGILLQSRYTGNRLDRVIAGVGINANFESKVLGDDLTVPPITLMEAVGKPVNLNHVLDKVLSCMETDYGRFLEEGPARIISDYKKNCSTIGRRVKILRDDGPDLTGTAADLGTEGGLMLRTPDNWTVVINNARQLILE